MSSCSHRPKLGHSDFTLRFAKLEIGSADEALPLKGRIANLSFSSRYIETLAWPALILGGLLVVAAVAWLMLPWLRSVRLPDASLADIIVLVVLACGTALGFLMESYPLPGSEWAILLAMGFSALFGISIAGRFAAERLPRLASTLTISGLAHRCCRIFTDPCKCNSDGADV